MPSSPERSLLFLHIRKTGGTSLSQAISNRFHVRDFLPLYAIPEPEENASLDEYRFVTGHVDPRFVSHFRRPPFVFTCLRDPVERFLSTYSYYRWVPTEQYEVLRPALGPEGYERRVAAMKLARELPIDQYIERAGDLLPEHFGNVQTRTLCGSSRVGGEEEQLDEAIEVLEGLDFVGVTDRLQESADWLARRLGWTWLGALPRTLTLNERVQRSELSPATLGALQKLTEVDLELYRHASRMFDQRASEWADAEDPSDPTAGVADAQPLRDLNFDEPIRGGGFYGRENEVDEASFCWLHGISTAWVELRTTAGRGRLVVEIAHAIHPSVVEQFRIRADGQAVRHEVRETSDGLVATAQLPQETIGRGEGTVRIELEAGAGIRPCDVNPESSDDRELTIAVRRVALV